MVEAAFGVLPLAWCHGALSALLVLDALAIWLHFRRRLRPVSASLDGALAAIQTTSSPSTSATALALLDQSLAADPIIGES